MFVSMFSVTMDRQGQDWIKSPYTPKMYSPLKIRQKNSAEGYRDRPI